MIEHARAEHLNHPHKRNLNRVGIFEQREAEGAFPGVVFDGDLALVLHAGVKEAMSTVAERGRTALHAVDFYVLTSWNVF